VAVISAGSVPDQRQSRAVPVRARSQASREALLQAAMALWRTKGFAQTSVTDICKAAGVSKALFYVYFSRREDVLLEVEVFAVRDAHLAARRVASRPYELHEVIAAVIGTLERHMRRFPAEVIFEAVLETYRLEQRPPAEGTATEGTGTDAAGLFGGPFEQARRDGKLPVSGQADVTRAARVAQVLVTDRIRSWAARGCQDTPLAEPLAREISALLGAAS
jgi:AcrR family transcriptional regulator